MAEMCAAICALNLGAHAIGVRKPFYCSGDLFVKAWPTAVGFKLAFRAV